MGNTPAKIKRITLQYMIPKGWTHTNKVSAGVVPLPAGSNDIIAIPENATVPPKGSLQRQYGISITTTNPVYPYSLVGLIVNSDNNRGLDENAPFVRLIGTIDYEEVFGQKEREQWCWINSGPSSPRNCLSLPRVSQPSISPDMWKLRADDASPRIDRRGRQRVANPGFLIAMDSCPEIAFSR